MSTNMSTPMSCRSCKRTMRLTKKKLFTPQYQFCNNAECARHGLLTIAGVVKVDGTYRPSILVDLGVTPDRA